MQVVKGFLDDISNALKKLGASNNRKNLIVILGIFGLLIIFLSNFFGAKDDNCKEKKLNKSKCVISMDERQDKMEKNLQNVISKIQNAGKTKVMITFEKSAETVYATEEKSNKEQSEDTSYGETTRKKESIDSEKKFITIKDSEGAEKALAVTEIEPKIKGVAVICQGGDDPIVKQRILETVTTLLNVTSTKVCVTRSG